MAMGEDNCVEMARGNFVELGHRLFPDDFRIDTRIDDQTKGSNFQIEGIGPDAACSIEVDDFHKAFILTLLRLVIKSRVGQIVGK
jgi:hypothetical protein